MLTIGKLGAGQEAYYLEKVAQGAEDYYSGESEAKGRWAGDAAAELSLEGEVGADQLTAMLTGRNPATGAQLLGMRGVPSGRGAVPGFDLTFSAPKSVSLLWALGDPETQIALRGAHERSVDAALGYLQRQACWTRRGAGGATFVSGNGFMAAAFRHRSSRAGDPQLHTHTLIANATRGPDGRWTRLYHPAIYDHAKTAGYLYESQLRHELTRALGVSWQPVRRGIAELEGFSDDQIREFSTRRAEILAAAGGPEASARARQVATLATRRGKEHEVSTETLRERWHQRAAEVGLDPETIDQVSNRNRNLYPSGETRTVLTAEQVDRAVTAHASHFDRRDAVQAVAQSLPNGAEATEVEEIADAYLATEHIVRLGEGPKGDRFTTQRIWDLERQALATAERMRTEAHAAVSQTVADHVIAARPTLKTDQAEMVRRLLSDAEGISIVIGEAGTGKSYAIVAAAEGWSEAGIPMRVAAPTRKAANVLTGEGLPATSVTKLLLELDDLESQGFVTLLPHSVLLIDEAAMVDSQSLARLIFHADHAEAKLVLVGDPGQLGEIEAGGLFRAIAERSEPIHLTEVIRHNHDLDRDGAKRIRDGSGVEAFELYRSEERVTVAPNADAKREVMVADWWASYSRGEDALMIAKANREVERLNLLARSLLRDEGRLGPKEIEVAGNSFAAGDRVITRVNANREGIANRMRWRVVELHAERCEMRLECLDLSQRVVVGPDYLERSTPTGGPSLEHAYAASIYQAQGATVERALVSADGSMGKEEFYVAMSRSREQTHLYATPEIQLQRDEYAPSQRSEREPLDHVREAIVRDGAQIAALDEQLRAALSQLPSSELVARRSELEGEQRAASIDAKRAQAAEPWFSSDPQPELPSHSGQAELAMAEHLLAERRLLAITAARIRPPDYITQTLGEKPSDPAKRAGWERGLELIERHRQTHGIGDSQDALGQEPRSGLERAEWSRQRNQLRSIQRQLGQSQEFGRAISSGVELGL